MVKVKDKNLPELAGIYNSYGKDALYKQLKDKYGIKYPGSTLSRMKTIDTLAYDATTDRFNAGFCEKTADDIFMSMDELCSQEKQQKEVLVKTVQAMPKSDAMDRLIKELLGDRLLELSRYVMLDTLNRSMTIDKTALIDAGYTLITH